MKKNPNFKCMEKVKQIIRSHTKLFYLQSLQIQ